MKMNHQNNFNGRLKDLNQKKIRKKQHVLYWMQQAQRAEFNHALEFAAQQANDLGLPLVVFFCLTSDYPEANARHYSFMLEGLIEVEKTLEQRGIKMMVQKGRMPDRVIEQGQSAAMIVCDRGYLRHQKIWREKAASKVPCLLVQVESDVIIPVEQVSRKVEYAARTIRPKIKKHMDRFLHPVFEIPVKVDSLSLRMDQADQLSLHSIENLISFLDIDTTLSAVTPFIKGGTSQAKKRFENFLKKNLENYDKHANQPQTDDISYMSPYLHFGQISPLYLAMETSASDVRTDAKEAFLEQLTVRRELAVNFVEYQTDYDRFSGVPQWARKTLAEHKDDSRADIYSVDRLEAAQTHDEYWNACMLEMKHTGFMHNYMRMYWGKKILEWSAAPEEAFKTCLGLNNKYFVDGRDPNSYASVSWLFGRHDRPFPERKVFGKVRYMSASGLERKCDIKAYVKKVDNRIKQLHSGP